MVKLQLFNLERSLIIKESVSRIESNLSKQLKQKFDLLVRIERMTGELGQEDRFEVSCQILVGGAEYGSGKGGDVNFFRAINKAEEMMISKNRNFLSRGYKNKREMNV